jgi:hypothetical protein
MAIALNHTIIPACEKEAAACQFARLLGVAYEVSANISHRKVNDTRPSCSTTLRVSCLGRGVRHDLPSHAGRRSPLRELAVERRRRQARAERPDALPMVPFNVSRSLPKSNATLTLPTGSPGTLPLPDERRVLDPEAARTCAGSAAHRDTQRPKGPGAFSNVMPKLTARTNRLRCAPSCASAVGKSCSCRPLKMDATLLRGTEEITNPHYLDQVLGVADRLRSGPCGSMLPCSGERPVVHVVPFCRAVGATTAKLKPLACAGTPMQPVTGPTYRRAFS